MADEFEVGYDGQQLSAEDRDAGSVATQIVGPPRSPGAAEREAQLCQRVADYFDLGARGAKPQIAAWSLVKVPSKIIITLNYDEVLEHAANDQDIPCRQLTHKELSEATQLLAGEDEPDVLTIVHVHGVRSRPETIVLSSFGYAQLRNSDVVRRFWEFGGLAKRLCFLGLSLDEPYVTESLAAIEGGSMRHVFVADSATLEALRVDFVSHGVHKVALDANAAGEPDYSALDSVAWRLSGPARGATQGGARLRRHAVELPEFYTEMALVEHSPDRDEATSSLLAEWDFTGDRRWSSRFADVQKQYSEKDLALEPRGLVIGEPGAGKSELLRSLARRVPAGTTPLLIRLADVSPEAGDAAIVLARWAERGRALRDDVWVSPERMREQDFHLLLDGLDEVSASVHGAVMKRIGEITRDLPQHRVTITTRPMEGLEAFPADEWRVIRLTATHRWQDAYLRKQGLTWDGDIAPVLRGINDAREILRLPFFLSQVLKMRDRGTLADREDLLGLLQALVDDALEREEARLALRSHDARTWLRRVALAMLLAGLSTVSRDALAAISLPEPVTASTEEVCEILIQRLMLRPALAEGEVGFTHRFFGACLAAEALEERGPTSALLAALVPERSQSIRGVRADALVPLGLVMSRSDAWRAAVHERDALAAARAVPESASEEERAMAARTLWETYEHRGVWIWDNHRPEVAEDARSLGRLLADYPATDLVAEVREAINDPDYVMQGNALAVLGFAGFTDIEGELAAILTDSTRQVVVRRRAALSANHLGLTALLPLIVQRATKASDDVEIQDCSLVAMNMASDEQLVSTATALASSGRHSAQAIALSHVQRRGSPSDVIKLLAASARAGGDAYSTDKDMLRDAANQIDVTDATTIEEAAWLAATWQVDDDALLTLLAKDPEAKVRGIGTALTGGLYAYELGRLADDVSLETMRQAGWPDEVIDRLQQWREIASQPAAIADDWPTEDAVEVDREPTLAELLERERDEETDGWLLHNSHYFAPQAAQLPVALRDELSHRLDDWWPERPYPETVTWKPREGSGRSWSQQSGAAAWVVYGPAIDKSLTSRQWAEIASSGVAAFEDQIEWLRRQARADAVDLVPDLLTRCDGDFWYPAIRSIPDELPVPSALVDAAVERLKEAQRYELVEVARRLEAAAPGTITRLSKVSESFAAMLRPLLASQGDEDALRHQLAQLRAAIETDAPPDADELGWLSGARTDPQWLDDLFGCLAAAWHRPSGRYPGRDVAGPLIHAISVISGDHPEDVVCRYDELLARGEPYRWLRSRREQVIESALGAAGDEEGPAAASSVGLSWLGPLTADPTTQPD